MSVEQVGGMEGHAQSRFFSVFIPSHLLSSPIISCHLQVSMEQVRIEAQFDGLPPSSTIPWSVNEYGDLTSGADSTGGVYDSNSSSKGADGQEVRRLFVSVWMVMG